jgi:tetratricopeptide (TPR) repeat protein
MGTVLMIIMAGVIGGIFAPLIVRSKARRRLEQALTFHDAGQARLALDALRAAGGALPRRLKGAEARLLILEERYEEAHGALIEYLTSELTREDAIRAQADLAWTLARMGRHNDAIREAQTLLAEKSASAECLELVGMALMAAGDPRGAAQALARALEGAAPEQASSRAFHLGEALLAGQRLDEAATAYERCRREDARSPWAARAQERLTQLAQQRPYRS